MQSTVPDWIQIAQPFAEITLALVAIVISIIALVQTKKQIKLSNKQQLFDRRLKKYTIIIDLVKSYANAEPLLTSEEVEINDYREAILVTMLNTTELEDSIKAVEDPMGKYRVVFYDKMRILKQLSEETKIIFENKEAVLVSDFIMQYREFLEYLFFEHYYSVYMEQKKIKEKLGIAEKEDETYFFLERKKSKDVLPELKKLFVSINETDATNMLLLQIKLK